MGSMSALSVLWGRKFTPSGLWDTICYEFPPSQPYVNTQGLIFKGVPGKQVTLLLQRSGSCVSEIPQSAEKVSPF